MVAVEAHPSGTDLGLFWSEVCLSQSVGTAWTIDGAAIVGAVREGGVDPRHEVDGEPIGHEGARAGVELGAGFQSGAVRARFDYRGIAPISGSEAHDRGARLVPAHSARWSRRIRGQLLVRNVIDAPEIHRPAGADLDLRHFISVTGALPNRR